jgi:hypothetical protein
MPEERVFQNLFPRSHTGDGSIDQDKARDARGVERGKGKADHVADVMGHEVGAVDLELSENAGHVEGLRLLVEAAGRLGRKTQSVKVGDQDGMIAGKIGGRAHMSPVSP